MAHVRTLLLTLASGSVLYSGLVPALGLGAITLHSALNQPLEAEIELLQMGGLDSDDIRVRLASDADFARSGVDRLFFLNDLRFTPLLRGNRHVIRVVSSKPVQEPYLNFIIEVARPNGQLLREYTVLLDPPSSSAYSAVAAAPVVQRSRANMTRPVAAPVVDLPPATQGQRYTVQRGDSLWLIAQRLREAGSSLSQAVLMEALYGLNPQAFLGGDKNRLSLGADLLLLDAAATVARVAAAPVAATDTQSGAPVSAPDIAQAAAPARDETQLRIDQELAQRAEENRQLQASMLILQAQLQALQEQMQAKDQQLELLRADLASVDQAVAPAAENAPAAVVAPVAPTDLSADASPLGWHWPVAGISLLLGALAGLALWRRRRQPEAAVVTVATPPGDAPAPVAVPAPVAAVAAVPVVAAPLAPRAPAAEADALEGANIYIAYGRFGEALVVLRQAIEQAPQRTDLRLRLLSVLGELGDGAGFNQEEAALREQGVELEQLDQLRARYASRLLVAPHTPAPALLEDAVLLLDEAGQDNTPTALDEFQLNLDDLSLDTDWDVLSPFKTAASTRARAADLAAVANDPG
ncbi:MAG: peptidoglycan-binding protein LysM, partial [Pseudomonadales bacterium]|nr:peptidoglycan-binding protein LysM [Pseudomonadales bacterium]